MQRRPLFGNGIPRTIIMANGEVTILDTEALDEKAVYALTLFMWPYQAGAGLFVNPSVALRNYVNGVASTPFAAITRDWLATFFGPGGNPSRVEPIKVLDRFMMRGKQKVTAQVTVDGTSNDVPNASFFWGYFEEAGDLITDTPFRGLQPSKLAAPFAYPPASVLAAPASANATQVIHKLDPNYVDLVTLDVAHAGASDGLGTLDFVAAVAVPGGFLIQMPSIILPPSGPANNYGPYPHRVFDGIPMRGLDASDAGSNLTLAAATGPGSPASFATAWGSFLRL